MSKLDTVRRSTVGTLDEILMGEADLKSRGIDVSDPDEWQQLKDIVVRIERRLMAKIPNAAE